MSEQSIAVGHITSNTSLTFSDLTAYAEPITANITLLFEEAAIAAEPITLNIGLQAPTARIYGTQPDKARSGDTVVIVGQGIGSSPQVFSPTVQGQLSDGSWANIPTESFSNVPASTNAYNNNRQIPENLTQMDWEHQEISIIVPNWIDPPNLPLRIVQFDGNSITASVHSAVESITANIT